MSEENMLEDSIARLLANHCDVALNDSVEAGHFPVELWSRIEEAGFAQALAREPHGFGLPWEQVAPMLKVAGYWNAPVPLAETLVGSALAAEHGVGVPSGPGCIAERGPLNALTLSRAGGGARISGTVKAVPWARHAHWLLAELAEGTWVVLDLQGGKHVVRAGKSIAGMPVDSLAFESCDPVCVITRDVESSLSTMRKAGAWAHAWLMVGALERALEHALQYAKDRVQFGRPVGRNQAIQQQLAHVAAEIATARMATAAATVDSGATLTEALHNRAFAIGAAKLLCGEAASATAAVAHQVTGALGFTREHQLQLSTRRLWTWSTQFGTDSWWADCIGRAAVQGGPHAFWPDLVDGDATLGKRMHAAEASGGA